MSTLTPQYCFACQQSFLNAQAYAAHTCTPQRLAAEVNRQSFVDRLKAEPGLVNELLHALDDFAMRYDIEKCGLPPFEEDGDGDELRALVLAWAVRVEAEKEKV